MTQNVVVKYGVHQLTIGANTLRPYLVYLDAQGKGSYLVTSRAVESLSKRHSSAFIKLVRNGFDDGEVNLLVLETDIPEQNINLCTPDPITPIVNTITAYLAFVKETGMDGDLGIHAFAAKQVVKENRTKEID